MLLIRHGQPGMEKTGVVLDGHYFDTSAFGEDYNEHFFGGDGLQHLKAFVKMGGLEPLADGAGVHQLLCQDALV